MTRCGGGAWGRSGARSPPIRMDILVQQVVSGLATGGIYASLALALVMIYQATDVVNFAQGELAMFATYICWSFINAGFKYWVAFLFTLAIAFVGGVVIELLLIRPVEGAPVLTVEPNLMGGVQIYAFAAATLGGFTSPGGAVLGGFIVGVVENLVGTYVSFIGTELKFTVALAMIIVVLLVKPTGLFGSTVVKRV